MLGLDVVICVEATPGGLKGQIRIGMVREKVSLWVVKKLEERNATRTNSRSNAAR